MDVWTCLCGAEMSAKVSAYHLDSAALEDVVEPEPLPLAVQVIRAIKDEFPGDWLELKATIRGLVARWPLIDRPASGSTGAARLGAAVLFHPLGICV
ncbi:hypothetical protein GCM10022197_17640 [Microlunatus spumicola]|uniref:Uncharacterized protein n=1 Tax=Microlunatus spumicola TaxID=81499 RepID=A0ABP6X817_9ACTN